MFALYAVPIGMIVGWLLGGRLENLNGARFRWAGLALAGLLAQLLLFLGPVAERVGDVGPVVYVASTGMVLAAVLRNVRVPGLPAVAVGATSNLLAIVANGGYMPASPDALAAIGRTVSADYSNSVVANHPALAPLTDIFALPAAVPFHNVFSVGDLAIALGVSWALVALMRAGGAPRKLRPLAGAFGTDER